MSNGSKFRHIYGDVPKQSGTYQDIDSPLVAGESCILGCNTLFFAVPTTKGSGRVYVRKLTNFNKFSRKDPFISYSKSRILQCNFNPFMNNMIASSSEDTKTYIQLFDINEGITQNVNKATQTLEGHSKKVILNSFNPSANNVLATASLDRTIRVWDIEKANFLSTFSGFKDNIYSFQWNYNGSLIGGTSKDKTLKIFDPRACDSLVFDVPSFEGIKSSKVFWVDKFNWIGSTGFNNNGKREIRLWDIKGNSKEPIKKYELPSGSGMTFGHYDSACSVLYCTERGTRQITYVEICNDNRKIYNINTFKGKEGLKGFTYIPKRGLDVFKCEIQRCLKLTSKAVIPISFIVPRKAGNDVFQDDLYPNAPSYEAALNCDEWNSGQNKDPVLTSLNPNNQNGNNNNNTKTFTPQKSTQSNTSTSNNTTTTTTSTSNNSNNNTSSKKPTYQELERKCKQLEDQVKKLSGNNSNEEQKTNETKSTTTSSTSSKKQGDTGKLFGELNRGNIGAKGFGLKKVRDDQKNKNKKISGVVKSKPKPKKKKSRITGTPKMTKRGFQYLVENYDNVRDDKNELVEIDNVDLKLNVYMVSNDNTTFQIKKKVKSVAIDNCQKCNIYIGDVVSGVELVNCKRVKLILQGVCPSVQIDKSSGGSVILTQKAFETPPEIYTSSIAAYNLELPPKTENDDPVEKNIPEQFKTTIDTENYTISTGEVTHG